VRAPRFRADLEPWHFAAADGVWKEENHEDAEEDDSSLIPNS
jgi:hypothetical protein